MTKKNKIKKTMKKSVAKKSKPKKTFVYNAIAVYAAEYDAPCVEFSEVYFKKQHAVARLFHSIMMECEQGSYCELNEKMYNEACENLMLHNECSIDHGEGNLWHWYLKKTAIV